MQLFNTTEKRMNELVFENRNKEYGAYAIRTTYDDTVTKSLGFIAALTAALLLISFIYGKMNPSALKTADAGGQTGVIIDITPPVEKKTEEKRTAAPKSNAEVPPVIK